MSWSNAYVGLPWADLGRGRDGADCWGLACIIYQEELGIGLPDYLGYSSAEERGEIAALIAGAETSPLWLPVDGPAIAFDIAVFRRGRFASHVGIVVRHGLMIHMEGDDCAKLADYSSGSWKPRFKGHYRHVERPVQIVTEARR
ncbi:NlpC/P60 family protein [Chachezhania antarctica]|uniref:NlpC/P60 family protein n=1 Tax=Chachezhania antarctica TaxID=2340860 RepID=UPI000EADF880|nr:NlpC/P60 family protein [Chachezhania antarctica]|tara:strand:- start:13110 stop:13541 length:432 start_codon:yes stop_codon:yes gene_type:complete